MSEGNGSNGGVFEIPVDQLVLTFDILHDHLEIGGHCVSIERMLDMLGRATRALEAKQREAHALEIQRKMLEAKQAADLARSVGLRG